MPPIPLPPNCSATLKNIIINIIPTSFATSASGPPNKPEDVHQDLGMIILEVFGLGKKKGRSIAPTCFRWMKAVEMLILMS